jgi:hypothetical protein
VWVIPAAIRYAYEQDITPQLQASMTQLEQRLMIRPKPGTPLHERIVAFGEVLVTIKEKELLGRSMEGDGDLPTRLRRLIDHVLSRHENEELKQVHAEDTIPVRVKTLRHHLLERMCDANLDDNARRNAKTALDDLHLVLQLYSYPGDYVSAKPTVERMAETVEKFEEDLLGVAKPKGKRRAMVKLGEPLDVKRHTAARARTAASELTARLEHAIVELMK